MFHTLPKVLSLVVALNIRGIHYIPSDVKTLPRAYIGVETQVCTTSEFKSYMNYRSITNKGSKQYKLQQIATTDERGFRRYGNYYLVAMTSQYGKVGDTLILEINDEIIKVMLGDIKDEGHDRCQNLKDKSMIEFIVDTPTPQARVSGSYNYLFKGSIQRIWKEKEVSHNMLRIIEKMERRVNEPFYRIK